jgi:hypothetical protein
VGPIAKFRLLLAISGDIDVFKNLFSSGALRSKTVWFGIGQLLLPVLSLYLSGGTVGWEQLLPVITGVGTLVSRANPNIQPLSAK